MSHNAALINAEQIENLIDHRSPFRDTTGRFVVGCFSPPESPSMQSSVSRLPLQKGKSFTGRWQ
jgi:hypothetical protein